MVQIIKLEDKEYEVNSLSDDAKLVLSLLQFTDRRLQELTNMQAIFRRAKNSYFKSLKTEVLSGKSGLFLQDD